MDMRIAKRSLGLLLACGWVAAALPARGSTETVPADEVAWNSTWSYSSVWGGTVTGVTPKTGKIAIPEELDGHPVTVIGNRAFQGYSGLTEVTIPGSVTSIGEYAFGDCSGLTEVTIPAGVTSIGVGAFSGCSGLTNVTIPDGVTSIGYSTFAGCSGLTEVTIPGSVTDIGEGAFSGCSGLTELTIPVGVTRIGYRAFQGCSALTNVTILGNITNDWWGYYPFEGCTNLTTVVLGEGMTRIGRYMFYGCGGLAEVTIPAGVTNIGMSAFGWCNGLSTLHIQNLESWVESVHDDPGFTNVAHLCIAGEEVKEIVLPDMTTIKSYAFQGCSGLTKVTIPEGVTAIGACAFQGCSGLTEVTIPASVKTIGARAFQGCSGLTAVTIPNGVTTIGTAAFQGCSGLTEVTIPGGVNFDKEVFSGCSGLTEVVISEGVTYIPERTFAECVRLASVTVPNSMAYIGEAAFRGCSGLTEVAIPEGVTYIGASAFEGCSGLAEVTIPKNVKHLGGGAFYMCSGLTNVAVLGNITNDWWSYGGPFDGCTNLVEIGFGRNLSKIGSGMFAGCSALTDVTIPGTVSIIGTNAFKGCWGVRTLTLEEGVKTIASNAFSQCGLAMVKIPSSVTNIVAAFSFGGDVTAEIPQYVCTWGRDRVVGRNGGWGFTNVVILPGVTNITAGMFAGLTNLVRVSIPASVRAIGAGAFSNCCRLVEADIPEGVETIGAGAFWGCSNLTGTLRLPSGQTSIGDYTFYGCAGLTGGIAIPAGVTNIGYKAFAGCSGLAGGIEFPDEVRGIGAYAFEGCSGLTGGLEIPDSVEWIGNNAFAGCSGLTGDVAIPGSVTKIYSSAFEGCSGLTGAVKITGSVPASAFEGSGVERVRLAADVDEWSGAIMEAFRGCTNVTSFEVDAGNTNYAAADGVLFSKDMTRLVRFPTGRRGTYRVPAGVTNIGEYAFAGCAGLTGVSVTNSVKGIGGDAFSGCTGLARVVLTNDFSKVGVTEPLVGAILPDADDMNYGGGAFAECTGLETADAPVSHYLYSYRNFVEEVREETFRGCTNLTAVEFPAGVSFSYGVGDNAFAGCTRLTDVTVPDGVRYLDDGAFAGCTGLTNVTLPGSLNSIGGGVFSTVGTFAGCTGLTSITVPGGVSNLYGSVFANCTGLTNVTLPGSLREIHGNAFSNCTGLASVTVPEGVTNLYGGVFKDCTGLRNVTLPGSLKTLEHDVFAGCAELSNVTLPDGLETIKGAVFCGCAKLSSLTLPDSLEYLGGYYGDYFGTGPFAGSGLQKWTRVPWPTNLVRLGAGAFEGFGRLTSVEIPAHVTNIGYYAFASCTNLKSVAFGGGIRTISPYAFWHCDGLTSVEIPGHVTDIGDGAFQGCTKLSHVDIGDGVADIGAGAFAECAGLAYVEIGGGVTNIHEWAFAGSGLESVVIPDGVRAVGAGAFSNCVRLAEATVGRGVEDLSAGGIFWGCTNLTKVVLGMDECAIQESLPYSYSHTLFEGCPVEALTVAGKILGNYGARYRSSDRSVIHDLFAEDTIRTVVFGDGVTRIPVSFLRNQSHLESVTLPAGVVSVGSNAFAGCSLDAVRIEGRIGEDYRYYQRWSGDNSSTKPFGECRTAEVAWRVPAYMFYGDPLLERVELEENVEEIGEHAFAGCTRLASVAIPAGVRTVGAGAFSNCVRLAEVAILGDITNDWSASSRPFDGCANLKTVVFGEAVTRIGNFMFSGARPESVRILGTITNNYATNATPFGSGIRSVHVEGRVPDGMFCGVATLEEVTLGAGVAYVGSNAFAGCTGLARLVLPEGVEEVATNAFAGCSGLKLLVAAPSWEGTGKLDGVALPVGCRVAYWDGREIALEKPVLPTGTAGVAYSAGLSAGGGVGPYTWGLAAGEAGGEAPEWISVGADGVLAGTPDAAGTWAFRVAVMDAMETVASADAELAVREPLSVGAEGLPVAVAGRAYVAALSVSGGTAPYAWRLEGAPGWLEVTADGVLQGTPEAAGTNPLRAVATDADGVLGWADLEIAVVDRPVVVSVAPAEGWVNAGREGVVEFGVVAEHPAGGELAYAWTVDGAAAGEGAAYPYERADTALHEVACTVSAADLPETAGASWKVGVLWVDGPEDAVAVEGDDVRLEARVTSSLAAEVVWYDGAGNTVGSGAELVLEGVAEGGEYRAVASNALGTATGRTATVAVRAPAVRVAGVEARQRYPWEGVVDIDYTLECAEEGTEAWIEVHGVDGETGSAVPMWSLSGEGAEGPVGAGTHRLTWDAGTDREAMELRSGDFRVELAARAGEARYLVVDLSGGADAERWPVAALEGVPAGGWTDECKTTKLVLRKVDAGSFTMGSPTNEPGRNAYGNYETRHEVVLTRGFWMGVFELTRAQWALATGGDPGAYGDVTPLETMSYVEARGGTSGTNWPAEDSVEAGSFMGVLRAKTGLAFDLPTEAQWENACRAGTTTALNGGCNLASTSNSAALDELGRYYYDRTDGKGGSSWGATAVGCYRPNAWGLYDMHGNAREWCLDRYGVYPASAQTNPVGSATGSSRVLRGGNGSSGAGGCRSASRGTESVWALAGLRACCTAAEGESWEWAEIGAQEWTNRVVLAVKPGTGWSGEGVSFEVVSGPGEIADGLLGFTGPGAVAIRATMGGTSLVQTVEVTKATAVISLADRVQEWDGTPKTVEVAVEPAGLDVVVTYDGGTEAPSSAGPHAVEVSVAANGLYEGSAEGTLVIVATNSYLVVDLAGGADAESWPVEVLDAVPAGGWTEEHKTTKLVLRRVEAGTFAMGSPIGEPGRRSDETQHEVAVSQPFYMGVFEVTQKQWQLATGSNPSMYQGNARPVERVTYNAIRGTGVGTNWPADGQVDAGSFLGVVRAKTGLAFDLPTEAQWEYACRAGTTTALNSGKNLTGTSECANMAEVGRYFYNKSDGKGGYSEHTTVGSYLPNAWGLYDMHGNVSEWCLDWYGNYAAETETDPAGLDSGSYRVARGGSWDNGAERCRSANRSYQLPNYIFDVGFRLACPTGP